MVAHAFNLALGMQRRWVSEFKASLAFRVSSRSAGATGPPTLVSDLHMPLHTGVRYSVILANEKYTSFVT